MTTKREFFKYRNEALKAIDAGCVDINELKDYAECVKEYSSRQVKHANELLKAIKIHQDINDDELKKQSMRKMFDYSYYSFCEAKEGLKSAKDALNQFKFRFIFKP